MIKQRKLSDRIAQFVCSWFDDYNRPDSCTTGDVATYFFGNYSPEQYRQVAGHLAQLARQGRVKRNGKTFEGGEDGWIGWWMRP